MSDRRRDPEDICPKTEDWGIFKNMTVLVRLDLTPLRRETSRGDLLCIGYLDDSRVEVVFPGRRRDAAAILETELDHFLRSENTAAQLRGAPIRHAAKLRFPLMAEGTWRTRLGDTDEDEVERIYQFMVASWTLLDHTGREQSFGEAPIRRPITRMPAAG